MQKTLSDKNKSIADLAVLLFFILNCTKIIYFGFWQQTIFCMILIRRYFILRKIFAKSRNLR